MPSAGGISPARKDEVIMNIKVLFVYRTGTDIKTAYRTVTLCKYTYSSNDSIAYIVGISDYLNDTVKEISFDNISSAKKRFLFEVENATIFTEE